MNSLKRTVILIKQDKFSHIKISIIIFLLATLDLLSKLIAFKILGFEGQESAFIMGYFDWFVTSHIGNSFELFKSDISNHWLTVFLISFLTVILYYPLLFKIKKIAVYCLIFIISGSIANVIDKIYNQDATNIMCTIQQSSGYHSVCFNIADLYILIGFTVGFIANLYYFSTHIAESRLSRIAMITPFILVTPLFSFNWLIEGF